LWFRNPGTLTGGNISEGMCFLWYTVAADHELSISKGIPVTTLKKTMGAKDPNHLKTGEKKNVYRASHIPVI